MFLMHLQYQASKEKTGDNTKSNIIFYALCVLYALSVVLMAIDTAALGFTILVSNNEHLF